MPKQNIRAVSAVSLTIRCGLLRRLRELLACLCGIYASSVALPCVVYATLRPLLSNLVGYSQVTCR